MTLQPTVSVAALTLDQITREVRAMRNERGLSNKALAERCGLHVNTLQKVLADNRPTEHRKPTTIVALRALLGELRSEIEGESREDVKTCRDLLSRMGITAQQQRQMLSRHREESSYAFD